MPDYVGDLMKLANRYVEGGGLRVYIKTNYGPEVPLYTGKGPDEPDSGPGIGGAVADIVGFKAQVIIRDKNGKTLQTIGPDSPTDWGRVSVLLLLLAAGGFLIIRRWL